MAFRDRGIVIPDVPAQGKVGCPFIYNVSMAVGPNGANRRDDVMLIQFLLSRTYGDPANALFQPPKHLKPLVVDGWYGETTAKWINFYQNDVASSGGSIFKDGRVDRARGILSSISKTAYTICWMNQDYRNNAIIIGSFETLEKQVPPLLASSIGP